MMHAFIDFNFASVVSEFLAQAFNLELKDCIIVCCSYAGKSSIRLSSDGSSYLLFTSGQLAQVLQRELGLVFLIPAHSPQLLGRRRPWHHPRKQADHLLTVLKIISHDGASGNDDDKSKLRLVSPFLAHPVQILGR